jgi:hypothetical protein
VLTIELHPRLKGKFEAEIEEDEARKIGTST